MSGATRRIRVPMQVGGAAARDGATGFAALACALAFPQLYVASLSLLPAAMATILLPLAVPGLLGGFAFSRLRRAYRERPSDLLIGPDGVGLEGGPHAALFTPPLEWAAVDPAHWSVWVPERSRESIPGLDVPTVKGEEAGATLGKIVGGLASLAPADVLVELRFGEGDDALTLASASRAEQGEVESFEALVQCLKSAQSAADDDAASSDVTLLRCGACGAPLAPDDVERVRCPDCAAENPVPTDLRERIRAGRQLGRDRRRTERAIARLLDQPGAAASVRRLTWTAGLCGLFALATQVAAQLSYARGILSVSELGVVAALPLAIALPWAVLAHAVLASRRALQALPLEYGALASGGDGAPLRCRNCLAPLPAATNDALVVRCAYCACESVLGVDLRRRAASADAEARSLSGYVRHLRRGRARAWAGGACALAALALVGGLVVGEARTVVARLALARACGAGDGASCLGLARTTSAVLSPSLRAARVREACRLRSLEACRELHRDDRSATAPADLVEACRRHEAAACAAFAPFCQDGTTACTRDLDRTCASVGLLSCRPQPAFDDAALGERVGAALLGEPGAEPSAAPAAAPSAVASPLAGTRF